MSDPIMDNVRIGRPDLPFDLKAAAQVVLEKKRLGLSAGEQEAFDDVEAQFLYQRGYKRREMTLALLPVKYRAHNVPLKDAFTEISIDLPAPYPEFYQMDADLKSLSETDALRVRGAVCGLSDPFWVQDIENAPSLEMSPIKRLRYVFVHHPFINRTTQQNLIKEAPFRKLGTSFLADRQRFYSLSARECVDLAQALHLSPAWVFGWADGKTTLMASTPINEVILAGYCFLSPLNQTVILRMIQELLKGGAGQ